MKYKSRLWFEKATTTYCVVENMALEADGRAMPRMLLDGGEVRGQIVEVLLPKVKGKGEKDFPFLPFLSVVLGRSMRRNVTVCKL